MLDVPNIKGPAMMITNSKNPSDAMNIAEMVKNKGEKKPLKMTSSIITVRKQAIQNSPAGNSMENHQG